MTDAIELVRHPRARAMRLSIDPVTGTVRLTIPKRASERQARAWAATKRDWIDAQRARLPQPRPFVPGAELPVGDAIVRIEWDSTASRAIRIEGEVLRCGGPRDGLDRRIERWLRKEALSVLAERTRYFAARAGVEVAKIAIGDARGRWGSCSSRGTIRYSWRLILAPRFVLDATVAHEVAHRVHMNHSPAFHALAASVLGDDPNRARAWLRGHGAELHWFGRNP